MGNIIILSGGVLATPVGGEHINDNLTTYDFGTFAIPRDGLCIVGFVARGSNNRTVSSVSIGGSNGTIHESNTSSVTKLAIASRVVSAGNNSVTATLSGANGSSPFAACFVWVITGYVSATPSDTDLSAEASATSRTATLTLPVNGFAVYGVTTIGGSVSWSTAFEVFDETQAGRTGAFAHKEATLAGVHAEVASWSTGGESRIIGAVWQ